MLSDGRSRERIGSLTPDSPARCKSAWTNCAGMGKFAGSELEKNWCILAFPGFEEARPRLTRVLELPR
jgi:hypothetical protein